MPPCTPECTKYREAGPSHCNIDNGGEPFWTGDPAGFYEHADQGGNPYDCKQGIAFFATEYDHAYRSIRSCDQNEDHHMVKFAETAEYLCGYVTDTVIHRACSV